MTTIRPALTMLLPVDDQPEATLIEQARAGDEAAFAELMRRYKRPVLNFVYRMLGDAAEADDFAQEVFVRVLVLACQLCSVDPGFPIRRFLNQQNEE